VTVRRTSVAAVVIVALVAVATLLMGVLGALNYGAHRRHSEAELRRDLAVQADRLAVALVLPIWNIDRTQIDRILESLDADREVYAVAVEAAGKTHTRVRDGRWRLAPSDGPIAPEGLLREERAITFAGEAIGSLRLYATPRFLEAELGVSRASILATILALDLLLILSVYLVLWRTVLKPLREIERYALAVKSGGPGETAIAPGVRFVGELESLRSSIEAMVRLLDLRYAEVREEVVRRRESEERARASEKRYRDIFDFAPIGILQAGPAGTLLTANRAFARILGYEHVDDVLGLNVRRDVFFDPRDRDDLIARYESLGLTPRVETRFKRRDGTPLWVEGISHIVRDGAGEVSYFESFVHDISARKAAEESLRRSETMSAMGALVAGVAHEVRNPLFGISASLDALESEFGGHPGYAAYAALLRAQVARLTRLMHDLLDYGKPPVPRTTAARPADLVKQAVRTCRPLAREQGVELAEDVAAGLPLLDLDTGRMEQVFENLVANAVQHSPPGGAVRLTARLAPGQQGAIEFGVEDEGPGAAAADMPRLFEPFFSRRQGGTGLGLPIIQRIVEAHGGQVKAANRGPRGAVFTVTLPVPQGHEKR
jgi:PAS domain S-box-containing protein